jgi:hypothetical protein
MPAMVRQAAQRLTKVGAAVSKIAVPLYRDGMHILTGIGIEGATMLDELRGLMSGTPLLCAGDEYADEHELPGRHLGKRCMGSALTG